MVRQPCACTPKGIFNHGPDGCEGVTTVPDQLPKDIQQMKSRAIYKATISADDRHQALRQAGSHGGMPLNDADRSALLDHFKDGMAYRTGLSVRERNPIGNGDGPFWHQSKLADEHHHVVYRDSAGKTVAGACVAVNKFNHEDGSLMAKPEASVITMAADHTRGLLTGRAVAKVIGALHQRDWASASRTTMSPAAQGMAAHAMQLKDRPKVFKSQDQGEHRHCVAPYADPGTHPADTDRVTEEKMHAHAERAARSSGAGPIHGNAFAFNNRAGFISHKGTLFTGKKAAEWHRDLLANANVHLGGEHYMDHIVGHNQFIKVHHWVGSGRSDNPSPSDESNLSVETPHPITARSKTTLSDILTTNKHNSLTWECKCGKSGTDQPSLARHHGIESGDDMRMSRGLFFDLDKSFYHSLHKGYQLTPERSDQALRATGAVGHYNPVPRRGDDDIFQGFGRHALASVPHGKPGLSVHRHQRPRGGAWGEEPAFEHHTNHHTIVYRDKTGVPVTMAHIARYDSDRPGHPHVETMASDKTRGLLHGRGVFHVLRALHKFNATSADTLSVHSQRMVAHAMEAQKNGSRAARKIINKGYELDSAGHRAALSVTGGRDLDWNRHERDDLADQLLSRTPSGKPGLSIHRNVDTGRDDDGEPIYRPHPGLHHVVYRDHEGMPVTTATVRTHETVGRVENHKWTQRRGPRIPPEVEAMGSDRSRGMLHGRGVFHVLRALHHMGATNAHELTSDSQRMVAHALDAQKAGSRAAKRIAGGVRSPSKP